MCFQNKSFPRFNHISRLKSLSYHTLNLAKPFCFYQSTLLLKFFLKMLNNVQTTVFAQSMNVFVFNSLIYNLDLSTKYHIKTFYSKISSKKMSRTCICLLFSKIKSLTATNTLLLSKELFALCSIS